MGNNAKLLHMYITKGVVEERKNIQLYNTLRGDQKETLLDQCNCAEKDCENKANTVVQATLFEAFTSRATIRKPGCESATGPQAQGLIPLCYNCANKDELIIKGQDTVCIDGTKI